MYMIYGIEPAQDPGGVGPGRGGLLSNQRTLDSPIGHDLPHVPVCGVLCRDYRVSHAEDDQGPSKTSPRNLLWR